MNETQKREVEHEIVQIVARARDEGWYEDNPGWARLDQSLIALGYAPRHAEAMSR
ncbi:hypothetical protein [Microbacterium foliorum]|uniref:Uncharacterized protein n=1 Tax=Microbacterium foliorum TaxID=104336 RepID=A0A0F0KNB1_9MICO|nr:hypothetical protein [Microbacterium foliorum]KJL22363.1 hypothetical protein RN50_01481 [Microbacterium foliorum]